MWEILERLDVIISLSVAVVGVTIWIVKRLRKKRKEAAELQAERDKELQRQLDLFQKAGSTITGRTDFGFWVMQVAQESNTRMWNARFAALGAFVSAAACFVIAVLGREMPDPVRGIYTACAIVGFVSSNSLNRMASREVEWVSSYIDRAHDMSLKAVADGVRRHMTKEPKKSEPPPEDEEGPVS